MLYRVPAARHGRHISHAVVIALFLPALFYLSYYNAADYLTALPFYFIRWPLEVDMNKLVLDIKNNRHPDVEPLNIDRQPIILDNDHLCRDYDGEQMDIFVLFVILSQIDNFASRQAIRHTYTQENLLPGLRTRRMFVLGVRSGDQSLQKRVAMEHQDYQDILQGYFPDDIHNATTKLRLGLLWATSRCEGAAFLAVVPDTAFISTYNLVKYLRNVPDVGLHTFVGGAPCYYQTPARQPSDPRFVSLEEYPYLFWPPYPCQGTFFISQQAAHTISAAMPYVQQLRFPDIYLGMVLWKLGISIHEAPHVYLTAAEHDYVMDRHRLVVAAHMFNNPEDLQRLWRRHQSLMARLTRH